jgi:hypothetical protein
MSLPIISQELPKEKLHDNAVFVCFSCQKRGTKIFAKIHRTSLQYVVCESACLNVALERLGIIGREEGGFKSPVNITVRNSPSAFVNHSPGSASLDKIDEKSDEEKMDSDPEGLKQLEKFSQIARKRLKMDDD